MILFGCTKLYEVGIAIQTLKSISTPISTLDKIGELVVSRERLESFLNDESFKGSIKVTREPTRKLIGDIDAIFNSLGERAKEGDNLLENLKSNPIEFNLSTSLVAFEHVFKEETNTWNTFIATPVAAYDVKVLIDDGTKLYEGVDLENRCPEAMDDIKAGARCLAFDLYTSSGFHFHRANESVILKYMKHLGAESANRNLGAYITALEEKDAPKGIIMCLSNLKDLYRNPLMHPEHSIESRADAIALCNCIHASIASIIRVMTESS